MAEYDHGLSPPYTPFDTFRGFIESLSKTAVPPHIDRSVMPKLSGGAQNQLISAMKFLRLLGPGGDTQESLRKLVKSFGTPDWKGTLGDIVFDAYSKINSGIDLDSGSSKQLRDAFRERGQVDGQMLEKGVRFFIKALQESGTTFSPHFKTRQVNPRRTGEQTKSNKSKPPLPPPADEGNGRKDRGGEADDPPPKGTITIPIYLPDKPLGKVIVPEDLSEADCEMIDSILRAYAKRRGGKDKK